MSKTIVVASTNPVKVQSVQQALGLMFPDEEFIIEKVSVPSGVRDQPMSDEETLSGAYNRAIRAKEKLPKADLWIGIEGGLQDLNDEMRSFAWAVVVSNDRIGRSRTATFSVPNEVSALIRQGKELGEADDIVFSRSNSKQDIGAVGILTNSAITRTDYYSHALVLALVPFKNLALSFPRMTAD